MYAALQGKILCHTGSDAFTTLAATTADYLEEREEELQSYLIMSRDDQIG